VTKPGRDALARGEGSTAEAAIASAAMTARRSAPKKPFGFASASTIPATSPSSERMGRHASDCTPSSHT
jgi:hypothetical protein